jgi:hypothetical protein
MSLIGTGDLRTWMAIPAGDRAPNAKLSALASVVEDFVDSYTNRALEAKTYYNNFDYSIMDCSGKDYIYLPVYPISYVSAVYVDSDRAWGSGTLIASADLFWYTSGKLVSEGGTFIKGRRNVRVDYIAGYAPLVGGTHSSVVSSYPIPQDLKQVMIEMCVESFKEGITAVHTVQGGIEGEQKFIQMLSRNSFWRNVLNKYKAFDAILQYNEE